jgi:hypothetical protein
MAAALIESLGLIDVRELMSGLTVPTLVLHRDALGLRGTGSHHPSITAAQLPAEHSSLPQRARILLAVSHAARAGTAAVDRVFRLAGSDAVFAHPSVAALLQRHPRR